MQQYPDAEEQLLSWHKKMKKCSFLHLPDLRKMFPTADLVGLKKELTCFNIKGNQYRLIVRITYPKTIFICEFLTHSEYTAKYVKRGKK